MRGRIIRTGIVALAVLVAAAVADAGGDTFTAGFTFSPSGSAGSPRVPAPISIHQSFLVTTPNGATPTPLTTVSTRIYGIRMHTKGLPVCTRQMIMANQMSDAKCPALSLLGQGPVTQLLIQSPSKPPTSCAERLDVFNGGGGKLVYFFVPSPTGCPELQPGGLPPFEGTSQNAGKWWTTEVSLPPVALIRSGSNVGTAYEALIKENLVYGMHRRKKRGPLESTGCQRGKRPWSVSFTATPIPAPSSQTTPGATSPPQTSSVPGSASCGAARSARG
jgi:hypothetical protein